MANQILVQQQISVFCSSLGMMLHAGVPLQEAVGLFAQQNAASFLEEDTSASPALRAAAAGMAEALARGDSFADAAAATGAFPAYALGVFRAAEFSGRLEEAMPRLADYYERQSRLYDRLRGAVLYPVALLMMMCVVLAVLVFGVLPLFVRVYDSLTGSVTASAYAYVPAAVVIGWVSLGVCAAVSAVLLAMALQLRTPAGRERLRRPLERSRVTRRAVRLLAVSQLTGTAAALLASGEEEESALELCLQQTSHTALHAALTDCLQEVRQGTPLAQALLHRQVLPALYGQMLVSGAQSGLLPQALEDASRQLGQEAEEALSGAIDRVEPVLIGYLTLTVGFTLLSVMLPLLGILSGV